MNKSISVALLTAGIICSILGIAASDSLGSSLSRFFTGSPTDKTIWLLMGGIIMGLTGLTGLLYGRKSN